MQLELLQLEPLGPKESVLRDLDEILQDRALDESALLVSRFKQCRTSQRSAEIFIGAVSGNRGAEKMSVYVRPEELIEPPPGMLPPFL